MQVWFRLLQGLRRYWRLLATSFFFGAAVAILWSGALLLTFPVIKVFLQGQHLSAYVQQEISSAQAALAKRQPAFEASQERLAGMPVDQVRFNAERTEELRRQAKLQKEINDWSRKLYAMTWVQTWIIPALPDDPFRLLVMLLTILLVATAIKGFASVVQDVLVGRTAELVVMDYRKAMYRHALKSDPLVLAGDGTARLMSAFTFDLQQLTQGLSLAGGDVIREPMKAFACIVAAFAVNFRLTCVLLIFVPAAGCLFYLLSRRLKRAIQKTLEAMSRIFKNLEETYASAKVVIAFGTQRDHRRRFRQENKAFYDRAVRIVQIDALSGPAAETLGILAVLAVLLPAGYLVLNHKTALWGIPLTDTPMDMTELCVLYTLLAGTLDPIRRFSKYVTKLRNTSTSAERIFEFLDREPAIADPAHPKICSPCMQGLTFDQVVFQYPGHESELHRPTLNGISLSIATGEVVAVVGTNGSGKSTLANLIPRFYDPVQGRILLDSIDLRDVRLRDLRRQIGLVAQDAALLDGTILENIRYGRPHATREDIELAAKKAHVLEFTDTFPLGLESPVGAMGRQLSGGQRQRVALARAILRDAPILILDEPTSAVDAESEHLIQQSLAEFVRGRTTIMITHSLSPALLAFVTRIVVMDAGEIVGEGSHRDLLATCPVYQRLFLDRDPVRIAA